MHDAGARGTNKSRLGFGHGGGGRSAVAGRDRLLDFAYCTAHTGAPRLIDHGAAGDLTGGLLGGFCISHGVSEEDLLSQCVLGSAGQTPDALGRAYRGMGRRRQRRAILPATPRAWRVPPRSRQ